MPKKLNFRIEKIPKKKPVVGIDKSFDLLLNLACLYSELETQINFVNSTHFSKEVKEEVIKQLKGRKT